MLQTRTARSHANYRTHQIHVARKHVPTEKAHERSGLAVCDSPQLRAAFEAEETELEAQEEAELGERAAKKKANDTARTLCIN
jgi:hypothetical protein